MKERDSLEKGFLEDASPQCRELRPGPSVLPHRTWRARGTSTASMFAPLAVPAV